LARLGFGVETVRIKGDFWSKGGNPQVLRCFVYPQLKWQIWL
jgi:hypothetical protein